MSFQDIKGAVVSMDIKHPAITWTSLVTSFAAMITEKADFITVFGDKHGPVIYILAHWLALGAMAQLANGDLHRPGAANAD